MSINLILREDKGTALTYAELDSNFKELKEEFDVIASPLSTGQVGGVLAKNIKQSVPSVAALRTIAGRYDGDVIYLAAHTQGTGKGGGNFKWDLTNVLADDDGVVIKPTSVVTGRWVRTLNGYVTPEMFGAYGDVVTNDTAPLTNAADYSISNNVELTLHGDYTTLNDITEFHDIKKSGLGTIRIGVDRWYITPNRNTTTKIYVNKSGSDTNSGISSSTSVLTIQKAVDIINQYGPIKGRTQVIIGAGIYNEKVIIPDGLAQNSNYLEFKAPSVVGVRGDPASWPETAAVLSGTGLSGDGFDVGMYNKVYVEYLLLKDWFNPVVGTVSQVVSALMVKRFSLLYTYGVSCIGNGYSNIYVTPQGSAVVTGGILDGARFSINNTGGRLSMTANSSTYSVIRNALEYGLYAKHESSSVLDYVEFDNCGNVSGAATYGAALFAYKSNTSIDTRNCKFTRNNIVYHQRSGGHIATEIPTTDIYGSGVEANARIFKITGFSDNDVLNYRSLAGRELCRVFSPASTSSTTTTTVLDNITSMIPMYFESVDQYMEIEIYGAANTGTGVVRPTWTSTTPANFGFGVFTVAPNTKFKIKLLIYPTGKSSQFVQFENIGATSLGATIGTFNTTAPFFDLASTFKIRGEISSGTLDINRVRVILWG